MGKSSQKEFKFFDKISRLCSSGVEEQEETIEENVAKPEDSLPPPKPPTEPKPPAKSTSCFIL